MLSKSININLIYCYMITSIYFKDDSVSNIDCTIAEGVLPIIITGDAGITVAGKMLDRLSQDDYNWAVFTNNPLLVDYAREIMNMSYDDIYIYDMCKDEFVKIQTTTRKELRNTHNFCRLWMGGTFKNTYNLN